MKFSIELHVVHHHRGGVDDVFLSDGVSDGVEEFTCIGMSRLRSECGCVGVLSN
jgi:hypothetical protein